MEIPTPAQGANETQQQRQARIWAEVLAAEPAGNDLEADEADGARACPLRDSRQIVCDELIELVAEMLGRQMKKGQIKRAVYYVVGGHCGRATIEKLMNRARILLAARANVTIEEAKQNALEFYAAIVADDNVSVGDRIKAQTRIDEIMGLDAAHALANRAPAVENTALRLREAVSKMMGTVPDSKATQVAPDVQTVATTKAAK